MKSSKVGLYMGKVLEPYANWCTRSYARTLQLNPLPLEKLPLAAGAQQAFFFIRGKHRWNMLLRKMLEISPILFNSILFNTKQSVKMEKTRISFIPLFVLIFLASCMEVEKPVTLGASLTEKKITMTAYSVEELDVEVYLITEEIAEGELLAKAMNASGQEIGRAKQILALGKDDAKKLTFTFDAELDLGKVVKYVIDFRKQ